MGDHLLVKSQVGLSTSSGIPPAASRQLHSLIHSPAVQVVGSKYVRLYAPSSSARLYASEEHLTTNSSEVDVEAVDAARFPEFASTPYLDCVLQPGQMLYIPPRWWHFVKALTSSFSVSFWWS
jgi:hypothetical protein